MPSPSDDPRAKAPPHREKPIPRAALFAAGALVVLSFAAAIAGRFADVGALRAPEPDPVAERVLRFEVRADNAVAIYVGADAAAPATVLPPERNGFVRGVLRGLDHERRLSGVAPDAPYRLVRSSDGRLTLIDPSNDRRIELFGFGDANYAAFDELMAVEASGARRQLAEREPE